MWFGRGLRARPKRGHLPRPGTSQARQGCVVRNLCSAITAITAPLDRGVTQAPETGGPDRHTTWLTTIYADGSPHVTAVGALWVDDSFWFVTGERTRKGRNLARDPRCTIAVSMRESDLVVEGDARQVTILRPLLLWLNVGPRGAGRAGWTSRAGHSPPSTARPQRDRHLGSSTASRRGQRPRSRPSSPAVRPGGDF
jgi:hypothetical protein